MIKLWGNTAKYSTSVLFQKMFTIKTAYLHFFVVDQLPLVGRLKPLGSWSVQIERRKNGQPRGCKQQRPSYFCGCKKQTAEAGQNTSFWIPWTDNALVDPLLTHSCKQRRAREHLLCWTGLAFLVMVAFLWYDLCSWCKARSHIYVKASLNANALTQKNRPWTLI